jgi:hypothetical protein
MSSYVQKAIDDRSYIPEMCGETLETIARLDKASKDIHSAIDVTVQTAKVRRAITKREMTDIESMRNVAESICEKKAQLAVLNYDLIDQHIRQLDAEIRVVEQAMVNNGDPKLKDAIGGQFSSSSTRGGDGKRRSTRYEAERYADEHQDIDPNEPVYCVCRQIAFGEMIACDNEDCAVEWFHYSCVNLNKKPKSSWLCPDCQYKKRHG